MHARAGERSSRWWHQKARLFLARAPSRSSRALVQAAMSCGAVLLSGARPHATARPAGCSQRASASALPSVRSPLAHRRRAARGAGVCRAAASAPAAGATRLTDAFQATLSRNQCVHRSAALCAVAPPSDARRPLHRPALIPFICAGDPDLGTTAKALRALDEARGHCSLCVHAAPLTWTCVLLAATFAQAGADIIELGVPYSDPLADGPTIQAAATRALAGGATLDSVLQLVKEVRKRCPAPAVRAG